MITEIMNFLVGNPYWFIFFMGASLSFVLGWAVEKAGTPRYSFIFPGVWIVIGGLLLLEIWAILTISDFFGIPLLVLLALIIVIISVVALIKFSRRS